MDTRFTAIQSIDIPLKYEPVPIEHYLRQPHRLVNALAAASQIQVLDADLYRLAVKPLKFLVLNIQPTVDLRIWTDAQGVVNIQSVGCELAGIEAFNQAFQLNLTGKLYPKAQGRLTHIQGQANLEVRLDLPSMLVLTPKSLIEVTGTGLLKGVLATIKQRLGQYLVTDYQTWARAQAPLATTR
jgi:Protein of unknown function (DUF1997)